MKGQAIAERRRRPRGAVRDGLVAAGLELARTGGPDAVPPGTAPQAVPPQYAAYMNSVHRSSPNGTATLLAALQPLEDLGLTRDEAIAAAFGHFPVAGVTTFTDDWWYPRYNQPFHLHQGTDIIPGTFSAKGWSSAHQSRR